MNSPALAVIKTPSTLSWNDANRHERTITTYVQVVSHLLRRYATDAVTARADEEMFNIKEGSLTTWEFLKKSWDQTLQCSGVYNE